MPRVVDVAQRRSELTEAAARVIARAGLEAATMREVASEAGWTTGALTHYFADKRELLLTTFQASLDQRRSSRRADLDDPTAELHATLEGALPLDDERRRHWMVTIAFCSSAAGDPELATAQRDAYRQFHAHVAATATAAGLATPETAAEYAEQVIGIADGIAVQALFDPERWPAARQLAHLDRMLALHASAR